MSQLTRKILEALNQSDYRPVKAAGLAKELNINKKGLPDFRDALQSLLESGEVREGRNGLLRPPAQRGAIPGLIKRTLGGFGYLIPHDKAQPGKDQDIFIARHDLGDAQTGDEVLVVLIEQSGDKRDKRRGRVVEVIQRATNTFVGTYLERDDQGFVQVDGTIFNEAIAVGDPGAKGARPNDKVVLEMVRFPSHTQAGEGVLIEVLGPRGAPGVDTLSIIREYGLPDAFPGEVLEEARAQTHHFGEGELGDRLDLTKELIVTIDPADARDFDDAISLSRSSDGHWHLGVHIADVAHFVQTGSALDREAHKRGTSVYLPDRVIPMLPEILSNGLASLQQGKRRFTKSVLMEFSAEGTPLETRFANSAIRVTRRFAYEEVLAVLEDPERHKAKVGAKVRALLARMLELAMLLRARRFAVGALELTMPEIKIDFDNAGKVSGAHVSSHDVSHQIIEEFMLAANIAVATALTDRKVPFLRRVHGDPDEAKLRAFGEFVNSLGHPLKRYQSRRDLQHLLDRVKQDPTMHAVNYALLRSMKQAEYSVAEIGHYALAVENYCHFTSPIRRYPDLTVHRLIDVLARGQHLRRAKNPLDMIALSKLCSGTERRAAEAERELVKMKLLAYMATRVGEELEAIITGVQDFGFFCQGVEIPAEGLVHVSSLADDYYHFDPASHSLLGRRAGHQFRLGDKVRVTVARVDVDRRQLDFRLARAGDNSTSQQKHDKTFLPSEKQKRKPPWRTAKAEKRGRKHRGKHRR